MKNPTDIRPSPIAGQWYSGDPRALANSVDRYLQAAQLPDILGDVIAVVAPHAGHIYSGPVAGYAFAALSDRSPEVVAVISPMHRPYPSPLLTTAHEAYQTPLGTLSVDGEALGKLDEYLQTRLGFGLSPVARDQEHSLEIEIPFLQRALDCEFQLLPVMIREQSQRVTRTLGEGLAHTLQNRPAVLVASSDLSHFYNQSTARKLDLEIMRRVEAFDPAGVLAAEDEGVGFACGRGAIAAVLWAARALGADRVQTLNYATSGDITGDYASVVGYGAAAIFRSHP